MKRKSALVLAVFLFACRLASGQGRTDTHITGHVIDASTGKHLPFVTLSLKGTAIDRKSVV